MPRSLYGWERDKLWKDFERDWIDQPQLAQALADIKQREEHNG